MYRYQNPVLNSDFRTDANDGDHLPLPYIDYAEESRLQRNAERPCGCQHGDDAEPVDNEDDDILELPRLDYRAISDANGHGPQRQRLVIHHQPRTTVDNSAAGFPLSVKQP